MGLGLGVAREGNPVYHGLGMLAFIGIKVLLVPLLLYIAWSAWSLKPIWVRRSFQATSAFLLLVVLNNAIQVSLGLAWN